MRKKKTIASSNQPKNIETMIALLFSDMIFEPFVHTFSCISLVCWNARNSR